MDCIEGYRPNHGYICDLVDKCDVISYFVIPGVNDFEVYFVCESTFIYGSVFENYRLFK